MTPQQLDLIPDAVLFEQGSKRLRQWLRGKHKEARLTTRTYSDAILHDRFGLVRLSERTRNFSWAKS